MNKDLLDQVPADEQPMASKLNSLIEDMQPSRAFQWDLETQLMEKAAAQPTQGWFTKIMIPVGWAIAAIGGVLLLNLTIRSLVPQPSPAAGAAPTEEVSFAERVRTGTICTGPLALGHGFAVFLTNPEKDEFAVVDAGSTMSEVRSFIWSPDGERLAIVGNSMGNAAVHIAQPMGAEVEYLLSDSNIGYLMDAAWSRDGKKFAAWAGHNNRVVTVINADGTPPAKVNLGIQILGSLQFTPDGESIIFYGADTSMAGLFEYSLDGSQSRLISARVEDESGYAFSPDGTRLAFVEMEREAGEARLISKDIATGEETILGILPIPQGSGSSLPESAHLSWSADGRSLVFDFGRNAADRAVYLAHADGTGLVRAAESAYAPSISTDGKCLAYISNDQVFILDLTAVSLSSTTQSPLFLADLPAGRGTPNFKQDKLQWRPNP